MKMSTNCTPNNNNSKKQLSEKENLWSSILSDARTRGNNKLASCKAVLVLGANESGKTTLVAKLQGVEDPKKGTGLEYAYIDVRDDYRDDHTRLSVWVLDGEPEHVNLLRFALNEHTLEHTLVMLTVAMTTPWALLEQLQHWAAVLADHVDRLQVDADRRQMCRQQVVRSWQLYVEPGEELEPQPSPLHSHDTRDDEGGDGATSPLTDGVLAINLGLDIVVVVTKTDYIATLEKEFDYRDEHLDFMQQTIRRFCLQYGAALFYTSVKEDKNCDLLYKYLTHRIYNFPFRAPALVVEKDAIFIPAGWDNMKKISILYENMHSCKPDDYYRDVIAQPITRKAVSSRETEVVAEDEQVFLARQQQILLAGSGGNAGVASPGGTASPGGLRTGELPLRGPAAAKSTMRVPGATPVAVGSPKKLDGTKVVGAPGGEGVLANFFNSLLHKKSGTSPVKADATAPASQTASAADAIAELDRLAKATNKPVDHD